MTRTFTHLSFTTARCSALAAATAVAAAARALLGLGVDRAFPLATLRCHVKCNSVLWHDLSIEPTRVRWEDGQVHMTSLETREANVQECHGVMSVYNKTNTGKETERKTESKTERQRARKKVRERHREVKKTREIEREREREKTQRGKI